MSRLIMVACLVGLSLPCLAPAPGQPGEQAPKELEHIEALIRLLGSRNYREREQADRELRAIGLPALLALRGAVRDMDLETSRRAQRIMGPLRELLPLLDTKPVRLKATGVPVADVIADLGTQTGYDIQLLEPSGAMARRRVTLDIGPTTFWQALDQFNAASGLTILEFRFKPDAAWDLSPARKSDIARADVLGRPQGLAAAGQIVLVPGRGRERFTSYLGPFRLAVYDPALFPDLAEVARSPDEITLVCEVAIEPRVSYLGFTGPPQSVKALGFFRQTLEAPNTALKRRDGTALGWPHLTPPELVGYNPFLVTRQVMRLKQGKKRELILKELTGRVHLRVAWPDPHFVATDLIRGGKPTQAHDPKMRFDAHFREDASCHYHVHVENAGQATFEHGFLCGVGRIFRIDKGIMRRYLQEDTAGGVLFQGMPTHNSWFLEFSDDQGRRCRTEKQGSRLNVSRNGLHESGSLRTDADARRLVLYGQKFADFQLPFSFKNLPLPD